MKKILIYSLAALGLFSSACSEDDNLRKEGEGRLALRPEIKSDIKTVSRGEVVDEALNESMIVWISNSSGPVRKYKGLSNIPADEWLVADDYIAEVWAGDSVSASWDTRWFKGSQAFTIHRDEETRVQIPCKIANVLVELRYDIDDVISEPTFTIGHKRGQLVYEHGKEGIGYFMMPSNDKNLTWEFKTASVSGREIKQNGVIENAQPATKYIFTIKADSEDKPIGGTYFDIKVDRTVEPIYNQFAIELPPIIDGYDFTVKDGLVFTLGEVGRKSMFISASDALTEAKLSIVQHTTTQENIEYLGKILGLPAGENSVDFIGSSESFLNQVAEKGINAIYDYDAENDVSSLKINFEEEFTNSLPEGNYEFIYLVRDEENRISNLTSEVRISNAPIQIKKVNAADVWATKATISAEALRENYGTVTFHYRANGQSSWTSVPASANLTAELTSLTPATVYEYKVTSTIDNYESEPLTFTTETAGQLPNSGFEDWYIYGEKLWMPFTNDDSRYWDSGNSALKTMLMFANIDKNPTSKDTNFKHSGDASVKLTSTVTAGILAAGNIFVGEFIRTDGTNGVLGWGRPWNSRPAKLKGVARYKPVAVTNEKDDYSALKKGDMDKGIIYIALLDNSISKEDSGKSYPVIVKTNANSRSLFSKTDSNVIAYGELVFEQNTKYSGETFVEFEIDLEYYRTDVKPSYIMCTASASIGGDYFVGGDGSTLWLDDLELVY